MLKIDPNFWKEVEDPNNLDYVVYGDSVGSDSKIIIRDMETKILKSIKIGDLWRFLKDFLIVNEAQDKQYIEISNFEILTYDTKTKHVKFIKPKSFIRHKINEYVFNIYTQKKRLTLTASHSLLNFASGFDELVKIKPIDAKHIVTYDYKTLNFKKDEKILRKKCHKYHGYVYDFVVPETSNFFANGILVHNTDSLYTSIKNIEYKDYNEALQITDKIASEINNIIANLLNELILPKMGVDAKYNKTNFKTESVISHMLFLNIKKNYAYKEIAAKGHAYEKAKIKYTGIPIVRSDYSKYAQDFIRSLIENIALSDELNKMELLQTLVQERYNQIEDSINNFNLLYVGTPGRWKVAKYKTETFILTGMRLYNTLLNSEVFRPGLNGYSLPIILNNPNLFLEGIEKYRHLNEYFLQDTEINNINYIVVPSNYEPKILKAKLEEFKITIDPEVLWRKNFSKIAHYIVDVIKESN